MDQALDKSQYRISMQQANRVVLIVAFSRSSIIQLSKNIPHSRAGDLEINIPSDCRSEYSEVKVR